MTETVKSKRGGSVIEVRADFANAASPIRYRIVDEDDDEFESSVFQVADARHDPRHAVKLIRDWLARNHG